MPSRIRRTRCWRVILPSSTKQPATVPTLVILKTSRTSAEPVTFSTSFGASMPSMACLISSMAS